MSAVVLPFGRGALAAGASAEPIVCRWCVAQIAEGIDHGDEPVEVPEAAIVIHHGKPACSFHSLFYVGPWGAKHPSEWGKRL